VRLQGKWEDLEFRLLDADTAPQMMPVYGLGEIITAHTHPGYFTSGWHNNDPLDIWSKSSGVVHIPLPEATAESLQLIAESRVLLTEMDDSSTVEVFANNHPVGVWHYRTDENWGERRVLIEPELLALRDDVLVLEFRSRRTLRPAQGDSRELGMLLRKMVLRSGE
jgi:hypothetical protein